MLLLNGSGSLRQHPPSPTLRHAPQRWLASRLQCVTVGMPPAAPCLSGSNPETRPFSSRQRPASEHPSILNKTLPDFFIHPRFRCLASRVVPCKKKGTLPPSGDRSRGNAMRRRIPATRLPIGSLRWRPWTLCAASRAACSSLARPSPIVDAGELSGHRVARQAVSYLADYAMDESCESYLSLSCLPSAFWLP